LSISSSAEPVAPNPQVRDLTQVQTERVVIGSVADISARYENGKPITVIHILEFSADALLKEPDFLQVRLCGDQGGRLESAVHTNTTLVVNPISQSVLTGCLSLISSEPWKGGSKWQAITFNSDKVKRSIQLEKSIQAIIHGAVVN